MTVAIAIAIGALVSGCGTLPKPPASVGAVPGEALPSADTPASVFEQGLRERAIAQAGEGRLADAATSWEVLTVLRPASADYRDRLADVRREIDRGVAMHLAEGAAAGRHADLDKAAAHDLAALALQPDNTQAADALRQIERERNKRGLGQASRRLLSKRADDVAR